jgi:hypothetical protein
VGTIKSRAHRLQRLGKIEPRPRGRVSLTPAQRSPAPPATPAEQVAPASPAVTFVAVPEFQEMLTILRDLQGRVGSLEQTRVAPALPAPPAPPVTPTTPAPPAPERKDIQQWTIRLSKALIEHIKAVSYEQRLNPSELVEQLLWQALTTRERPRS